MYSSSKWPYTFVLLLCFATQCFGRRAVNKTTLPQPDNHSFVVNVCLTAENAVQLFSGVLVSRKRILSVCHPFVNTISKDGQVALPSIDHFRVWAGYSEGNGQWRSVVNVQCIGASTVTSAIKENNVAVLIVGEEFELAKSLIVLDVSGIMTMEELTVAMELRMQCKVVSWLVKFKAKLAPDMENSILKECPVETSNMSTCAKFLSAEVADTSSHRLVTERLMCGIPDMTTNRSCVEPAFPGSPVICSRKILGLVTFAKKPALVETFPVILTPIPLKSFITLSSLGRTTMNSRYSALASLILNAFLMK